MNSEVSNFKNSSSTNLNNPYEPELADEVKSRSKSLRKGFTTGACAAAATKAAAIFLTTGKRPSSVEIVLPKGNIVAFDVEEAPVMKDESATDYFGCVVVKDAGDDPDCTNGARITAYVRRSPTHTTHIQAGDGVGTVTLPGLGIEVGMPSITKVPMSMILTSASEVTDIPLDVIISVPNGEEMAKQTTNDRLGIIGGISILGTTGIVKPFSTAAYRASVVQQIDVASAQNEVEIVLSTGHRSELVAMDLFNNLRKVSFIEVGDFTGVAVKRAVIKNIQSVYFFGMLGKISKLASGIMMTHYKRTNVDTFLLQNAAQITNAPESVIEAATSTNTARHFFDVCLGNNCLEPLEYLTNLAQKQLHEYCKEKLHIQVFLVDFEGQRVVTKSDG